MNTRASFALWAMLALAAASTGCSSTSTCSRDPDTIDVYDGSVNADRTQYSSVQPAGQAADGGPLSDAELQKLPPYTYFPANRSVRFHIGLVATPTDYRGFLAFLGDRDISVAPCAGNQCVFHTVNKDEIVVKNDTCSEFWLYLTASTSATPFHPLSDGGAAGGASGVDPTDTAGAAGAQ
ncbi:MAG TPA: hypothetical protein VGC79_35495 [Polyangiaceae bacterium]